jgi:hypothetical protein
MKNLAVFCIFFIASFFIGAAPLLLAIGVIWLVAAWQSRSGPPPPDSEDPSPAPPPTPPTQYRRPTPPRTPSPHRRINLTHHK